MKLSFTIILFVFFSTAQAQQGEHMLSLNGDWKFRTDPNGRGESLRWYDVSKNVGEWDSLPVPGNWDLRNEYAHYAGKAWYRKEFVVNPDWKNKTVRLLFQAVNWTSKVWLNGKLIGTNDIGYLPFEMNVSSVLNMDGNNTLVVLCDNSFRVGALWNWGGIRRPVTLVATPRAYIAGQFITPSVDLQQGTAKVRVRILCRNDGNTAASLGGDLVLSAGNGFKRVLPFTMDIPGGTSKEIFLETNLSKPEVHLWNCDDPYLYQSAVSIKTNTQVMHQLTQRFGLRKVEVDNKNFLFKLNGEPIRPMGFNLVPDDRTTGSTLPLWRVKEDIDLMKSLGANMARLTHVPLHQEMFDYMDEKGMLVIPEIPLWGLDPIADKNNPKPKQWLHRFIWNNYNHPCIIGWSVGNEIGHTPGVMEYVEDAIDFVKKTDTSRLSVVVSHTAGRPKDPIVFSDLALINTYGVGIGATADRIHALHPGKVMFLSEYGYGQLREDLDADVDARGMVDSIRFKPYLVGGALWTFNDYRSSFAGTKEFSENRPWGIVDVFRQKKKAWYGFRKAYAPIRDMKVEFKSGKPSSATITIIPRQTLDLPAYTLKDYVLLWTAYGEDNKLSQGGMINLPVIKPGDAAISKIITWQKNSRISKLKIDLLSPQHYSLYDTTVHFSTPEAPEILFTHGGRMVANSMESNNGAIRIVFIRKQPEVYYKATYGKDDLSMETPPTLNSFFDISKMTFGETYQVAVVGMNAAGEGKPSPIKKVKVETGLAPPVVYYVEPADRGFYLSYATQNDDYLFKVQYTTTPGNYENASGIQSRTRGVMFVPGLVNGQQYYFRMSRIKDNNYETGWSEEYSVMPDGDKHAAAPTLEGIIRTGSEAAIIFEPVKKAIGYVVQYRRQRGGDWKTLQVNASALNHIRMSGLDPKEKYEFRMAAENACGQSEFTSPLLE